MIKSYLPPRSPRNQLRTAWWLALLVLMLLNGPAARAQSGPYGNEWIVAGQPYYKIKVWRDGIYRLDYAYLSQLSGVAGVAPAQLQLWRRGKQLAVYQGGSSATLDNSTYLEFYGQRNDGALDRDYYKKPSDQPHQFYSFYTDTAAYFLTWGSQPGKRMAQPLAAGGTPHAWRIQTVVKLATEKYMEGPTDGTAFMPWLEQGEGFMGTYNYNRPASLKNDSLFRGVVPSPAPAPTAEVVVIGGSDIARGHQTSVRVIPPGGTYRELGVLYYPNYNYAKGRYQLQSSDINANGQVEISCDVVNQPKTPIFDFWRYSYVRLTAPVAVAWYSDRRSQWFSNDSLLGGPATYEVDNVPATVYGYDIHDPWDVQRIEPQPAQQLGGTARRYVFPRATDQQSRRLLLADAARPLVPGAPRRVYFRTIDPARPNFVIISHPKLMGAAGNLPSAGRAYANYRASAAGGGYDTLLVMAPLLYDQFHYGERSVLALRHFALWVAAASPTKAKYLLLLGKGLVPGATPGQDAHAVQYFGVYAGNTTRALGEEGQDLVPTSTRSPSDNFLSSDWPHDDYVAKFATGRLQAVTPQEVADYLAKVQAHESLGLEPWRKNVLHLVGGEQVADFQEFGGYLDRYKSYIERPFFGGTVTTIRRAQVAGLPTPLNISNEMNTGLSMLSYFGHGSTQIFDFDLGDINDPVNNYHNVGRYPMFVFNGCEVGDSYYIPRTFASNWTLAPSKGIIGLMAQTGASYAYLLDPAQDLHHRLLFNDPTWYGQPVAAVRNEVTRRLQGSGPYAGNLAGIEQLLCTVWQGDPALRLFAPPKPDFIVSNNTLSLTPGAGEASVDANAKTFVLNIGMSNPGRVTFDSVEIRITRSYNNRGTNPARPAEVVLKTFRQAWRRDTTYTVVLNNIGNVFGDNVFKVELDYRNKVAELDETNNTAELTFPFLQGGLTLLTPTEFAIVKTNTPRLVAQTNDPNGTLRGYDFELDTVATFNSPLVQRLTGKQATLVADWKPTLPTITNRDSVVWYWRVHFSQGLPAEDNAWRVSSFRVIQSAPLGGWSQSHYAQFQRDQLTGVAVAAPNGRWSFAAQRLPVLLRTVGGGAVSGATTFNTSSGYGIALDGAAAPYVADCGIRAPNLIAVVFDPHSLDRIAVGGGNYATCGQGSQTFYHFAGTADTLDNLNNSAQRRQQLKTFLANVPDGAYVAFISVNRLRYASLLPDLGTSFATLLGSKLAAQLHNGDGWALVAQKFASGGHLVQEAGPDRSLSQPAYSQNVELNNALLSPGMRGTVLSTLIGPAREWQTLFNTIRTETATASYTLSVSGVDAAGKTTVLNSDVKTNALSLSNVSATAYPYLQLQLVLRDSVNRVPPQLKQWLVTYKGLPEGVVRRDLVNAAVYDSTRFKAQAAVSPGNISFPVKFDNVSSESFTNPLQIKVELLNAATGLPVAGTTKLVAAPRAPVANDTIMTAQVSISLVGLFGKFIPHVVVNPQLQPELYYFNNELKLDAFTVRDNNVPPTLDVAVDGRHILDGELVSPRPVINIQLKDEDRLRLIQDASYFTVFLQKDNQVAVPVDVNGPLVSFTVDKTAGSLAKLEYQPGLTTKLADGMYTLRVQGRDPSNAKAGTQDYQVKFQVVNASTITNVFPYPNPVTSKARFVFTVTGQELPRNMKIQIMTLTGRVVREIFMAELGPLHIGNNLTDYAWDGTDQYGDRLANGTYLYRVAIDDPNGDFQKRATAGDQAFKNDWGKLVLLR